MKTFKDLTALIVEPGLLFAGKKRVTCCYDKYLSFATLIVDTYPNIGRDLFINIRYQLTTPIGIAVDVTNRVLAVDERSGVSDRSHYNLLHTDRYFIKASRKQIQQLSALLADKKVFI